MKISILTVTASLFCGVMLQGMKEGKDVLKFNTYEINIYDGLRDISSVNCRDKQGNTPLIFQARNGNDEKVQFLLKNDAAPLLMGFTIQKPDLGYYQGPVEPFLEYYVTTALNEASKNCHKNCMQYLIEKGAKPFKINSDYIIPQNPLKLSWRHWDENKAPIHYVMEKKDTGCVKMLFEWAIAHDKKLHDKTSLVDYVDSVSGTTSYKNYVGNSSYKEYLRKNITFLLLVNKFSPYKSVHFKNLVFPKPVFNNIVLMSLYNTYPTLSEGLKVGAKESKSPEITRLFNEYTQKYEKLFPENSFVKYVEPKFFDKNCVCF